MYPPHHFGGYELIWRSAMHHLERHGHRVRVLTTDLRTDSTEPDDPFVRRELRWYLRDNEFPRLPRLERVRIERHNARVLREELSRFEPDVVSWWAMGGMSLSLIERVRRLGIPAVAFVIDHWLDYGRWADGWTGAFAGQPEAVAKLAERIVGVPSRVDLARAAHYVFVSEATRGRAIAAGVEPASSEVVHAGIAAGYLGPAPERQWSWSLAYVGRLDARKGVDTAVKALAHLPDAATLTLVGGWDEKEERRLRELAHTEGLAARVRFEGQASRDRVRAAYDDADAVLFPVRWEEPWGLVPLEAMARGRPVVASGRGGSGEYLRDGENALIASPDDTEAVADAVKRLAADRALRSRLRENGLATAGRYTEERYNEAVLRRLESVVGSGRGQIGPRVG